jgi:membrane protease YdiL (CAAX protease family)
MPPILLAIALSVSYVAVIYLASWMVCPLTWTDRDEPSVMKARATAVLVFSLTLLWWTPPTATLYLAEVFKTLFLLSALVYVNIVVNWYEVEMRIRRRRGVVKMLFYVMMEPIGALLHCDWYFLRDIAIGPIAEECVFRQALFQLVPSIWVTALLFSLAHSHRLFMKHSEPTSILFQCGFTFLFGLYVGGIFARTGSLLTCALVHSICNWVGFPNPDDFLELPTAHKIATLVLFLLSVAIYLSV